MPTEYATVERFVVICISYAKGGRYSDFGVVDDAVNIGKYRV